MRGPSHRGNTSFDSGQSRDRERLPAGSPPHRHESEQNTSDLEVHEVRAERSGTIITGHV